jgi:Anti-sigma-K factor rskA, C-terminal/Putative zinc-finger
MTNEEKSDDQKVEQPEEQATAVTTAVVEEDTPLAVESEPAPEAHPEPPGDEPRPEMAEDDPHANLAAYLLDALPDDERAAFAEHLGTCAVCQEEAAALAPIVGSLPGLLNLDPAAVLQASDLTPLPNDLEPSSGLRDKIMTAVHDEPQPEITATDQGTEVVPEIPTEEEAEEIEARPAAAAEPIPISTARRPRGRILPGVSTGPPTVTSQAWQTVSRVSWASRIAAILAIVAVGAIIWALALQGRVNDLQDENKAQATEIAEAQNNSNATVAQLSPTADGKQGSQGKLIFSLPDQTGWVLLEGMNPLPADQAYQVWYLKDGVPAPKPGPVITVDQNGNGNVEVAPDTPTYDGLALTAEPKSGSEAPTSPIVLQGRLSGAAG